MKNTLAAVVRLRSLISLSPTRVPSIRAVTLSIAAFLLGVSLVGPVEAQSVSSATSAQKPNATAGTPVPIYDPATGKLNAHFAPRSAVRAADAATGTSCTLIDFEGLANIAAIPTVQGVSLPDWLSIVSAYEAPGVGSGNFNGEPSPVTIAFWLYGDPNSQNVDVPNGASSISFYYSSYYSVTVTGYDSAGKQLATTTVPPNFDSSTRHYDIWQPVGITAPAGKTITSINISGYANYTGMDNLSVCQSPAIASVEMTQAIQQYQTLADLKATLKSNGEPPVPIVSNKPAVLRTYFNPVQDVTGVTVKLTGVDTQTKILSLQPGCTVDKQRAQTGGCQSMDFYVTPPSGSWTAQFDLVDGSGNVLEEEILPVTSRDTNSLRLSGVSVCDAKDASGDWLCSDAADLLALTGLIDKITPASTVQADISSSVVRQDIAATSGVGTQTPSDVWWDTVTQQVASLWGLQDAVGDLLSGRRTTYFGMVRPAPASPSTDPLGGQGGQAQNIPSYGAAGRTSALRFASKTETSTEVVAHETGHTLGLKHTNTMNPSVAAAPPGCYNFASDSSTDWIYPTGTAGSTANNNQIQSKARLEVGYDVALHSILNPNSTYEVMSYCSPRWISPQRYKTMIATLGGGPVASSSAKEASETSAALPQVIISPSVMPFWQVRGSIQGSTVAFLPLFEVEVKGDTSAGTGSYALVVEDAQGKSLFTRNFTPSSTTSETSGKDSSGSPAFSQLLPVEIDAAAIVLKDAKGVELGRISLGGKAPVVTVVTPTQGFVGTGVQTVSWSVQGPSTYTTKVLYSSNNGTNWTQIGEIADATSLSVDFSKLAGSTASLLQFRVSDGVNTGVATSVAFTVPKKAPRAVYITSPTPNYSQAAADPLLLRGAAYDADDGTLTGAALQWSSDIQGELGSGSPLSVKLKPGTHTITLTATDQDGNAVTAKTVVLIGGAPPVVSLTVQPLNTVPTTCESATVGAKPGVDGAALATVQYSVDGGATYTTIPLSQLPYAFIVPGSGFVHVVARAYDLSRQSGAQDSSFLVQSACQGISQTITFGPIANQVYGAAPLTLKATASSGLPVTYKVTGPATISGSALTITGVGTVTVTASQPGNTNYAPAAPIAQSFTVSPATLVALAASFSRAYGAANPVLTYSLSGFVNNEGTSVVSGTATLATTAKVTSPAGKYPITFATEGLTAKNYVFTYAPGTLTVVGGAAQTITFGPIANQTYGAGPIALSATASSGLPITYTVTGSAILSGSSLKITGAGQVSVTASQAGNASYSAAASVTRSFTVAKASLTAKTNNVSRLFGAANPALTYGLTGFVNGDTSAVTGGTAVLSTTATPSSPVGTYPITFSSAMLTAASYSFTYVPGTLTVTPLGTAATPVISLSAGTYAGSQPVTLSDATVGSTIFYTTDGTTPSAASTKYVGTITVAVSETLKAIAVAPGYANSAIASATYVIGTGSGGSCSLIDYKAGFTGTGTTLNGSAKVVGGALQLTDGGSFEAGSAFFSTPLPLAGFTTDFTFQLVDPMADGITFVLQNGKPTALGQGGGGLGYAGIPKSAALKFDLHNNAGEGASSTGTYIDGAYPSVPSTSLGDLGVDLHSGHKFAVHIAYDGTDVFMVLKDLVTNKVLAAKPMSNLKQILGGDTAYFGFTGGTGRLAATEKILSWTYSSSGCTTK